jgi:hypothetical protein
MYFPLDVACFLGRFFLLWVPWLRRSVISLPAQHNTAQIEQPSRVFDDLISKRRGICFVIPNKRRQLLAADCKNKDDAK